jgi:hypothetical protein
MHMDLEESLRTALASYRVALIAMGDAGARAYPPTGENLKQGMLKLQGDLANTATPGIFEQTGQHVGKELKAWGDCASHYYQQSADEIKSLLLEIAKAAGEVGDRDQRYGVHFQALAGRLQGAAQLDDISAMRQSLSSNAVELVNSIHRMTEARRSPLTSSACGRRNAWPRPTH